MLYRPTHRVFEPAAAPGPIIPQQDMVQHLRLDGLDEVYLVDLYLAAATAMVEARTQRLLAARTCVLRLPWLPADMIPVELPGGNVTAVASVVVDGVTVSSAAYAFAGSAPAQLMPLIAWPVATGEGLPVVITYTAGYPANSGAYAVPEPLKMAVMMVAAELFERRQVSEGGNLGEVPVGAQYLMEPYRIRAIG